MPARGKLTKMKAKVKHTVHVSFDGPDYEFLKSYTKHVGSNPTVLVRMAMRQYITQLRREQSGIKTKKQ